MIDLADIQEHIRETIAAGTVVQPDYFEDGDVIVEDGNQKDAIEQRLASRGFVVVVDFPVEADTTDRGTAVTECDVLTPVHIQVNPQQNVASAQKSVLEIVDVVSSALLASGDDGTDRYEHAEKPFELIVNDAGLVAYVVWIRRMTTLAEVVNN